MKYDFSKIFLLTAAVLTLCAFGALRAETRLWPLPADEDANADWTVKINGETADVVNAYTAQAPFEGYDFGGDYGFVSVDTDEPITLEFTTKQDLSHLEIRPASLGLTPEVNAEAGTVTVKVDRPCRFSIEPNGIERPVLVFVNPLETNIPKEDDANTLFFGPGIHRVEGNNVKLTEGQTLYLAPGAILKASVSVAGDNVAILGRGIIDSNEWEWLGIPGDGFALYIGSSRNVTVDGIILRGASHWTVRTQNSENITINNIKLCGSRIQNDDGIDPCNTRHLTVTNSFLRTDDDCVAIKEMKESDGDCSDLLFEKCVFWTDRARVVLIGHECHGPSIKDVIFRDCDIIHARERYFLIENGEEMLVENILFENIRVQTDASHQLPKPLEEMNVDTRNVRLEIDKEEPITWLLRARPVINMYMRKAVPAVIRDVTLRDITITGPETYCGILLNGMDEEYNVDGVTFENCDFFGKPLSEDSPRVTIGKYVENVTFK